MAYLPEKERYGMTNITDIARECGFFFHKEDLFYQCTQEELERFAALHRAAIIEELTGEMPEPVAWRCTNWSGSADDYIYRDADDCAVNVKGEKCGEPLYTADQMHEYAAGMVLKEREACANLCERHTGWPSSLYFADAIRNRGNV
jgi:hypothetical protein